MLWLASIAFAASAIPLLLLCIGDPKRRRGAGGKDGLSIGRRRAIIVGACIPGAACAIVGDAAAFMIWLGGVALLGWVFAVYVPKRI